MNFFYSQLSWHLNDGVMPAIRHMCSGYILAREKLDLAAKLFGRCRRIAHIFRAEYAGYVLVFGINGGWCPKVGSVCMCWCTNIICKYNILCGVTYLQCMSVNFVYFRLIDITFFTVLNEVPAIRK